MQSSPALKLSRTASTTKCSWRNSTTKKLWHFLGRGCLKTCYAQTLGVAPSTVPSSSSFFYFIGSTHCLGRCSNSACAQALQSAGRDEIPVMKFKTSCDIDFRQTLTTMHQIGLLEHQDHHFGDILDCTPYALMLCFGVKWPWSQSTVDGTTPCIGLLNFRKKAVYSGMKFHRDSHFVFHKVFGPKSFQHQRHGFCYGYRWLADV